MAQPRIAKSASLMIRGWILRRRKFWLPIISYTSMVSGQWSVVGGQLFATTDHRPPTTSFIPQRDHRIYLHRSPRREITREQRHKREQQRDQDKNQRVGRLDAKEQI